MAVDILSQQRRLSQLQRNTSAHHLSFIQSSHLLDAFSIFELGKDHQQDVQNTHNGQRDVDRLVPGKVSVGEDIVPVHWRGQHQKTSREGGQMRREALRLLMIRQWSDLQANQ